MKALLVLFVALAAGCAGSPERARYVTADGQSWQLYTMTSETLDASAGPSWTIRLYVNGEAAATAYNVRDGETGSGLAMYRGHALALMCGDRFEPSCQVTADGLPAATLHYLSPDNSSTR